MLTDGVSIVCKPDKPGGGSCEGQHRAIPQWEYGQTVVPAEDGLVLEGAL